MNNKIINKDIINDQTRQIVDCIVDPVGLSSNSTALTASTILFFGEDMVVFDLWEPRSLLAGEILSGH